MFETLRHSLKTGVVTTSYPQTSPEVSSRARGKPEIDWANWKDARPAAAICPTGAIEFLDKDATRFAALDLGKCIFCGLCAEVDKAIRMTNQCELAARQRASLKFAAKFHLTQREGEALDLLMHGQNTKQIASCMDISPNTAKAFLRSVMFKMGVCDRSGILAKILQVSEGVLEKPGIRQNHLGS